MKTASILVFVLFLGGCYATGKTFREAPHPDHERTSVYVYRHAGGDGIAIPIRVYLDGKKIASLHQKGFTWFYVPKGRHDLTALPPSINAPPIALWRMANSRPIPETLSTYYFRYYDDKFERVPDTVALKELSNYRYTPAQSD